MKYKTTAKAVKEGYPKIIRVGYCELQTLLRYEYPVAYSKGVYGWNFDVYDIDGVAIVTGYRNMPGKNTSADYKTIREYEARATAIKSREDMRWLLKEFIDKACA